MTDEIATNPANSNKQVDPKTEPVSLYNKTEAIVKRQEEANKKSEEILDRQEALYANQRLAGTAGGHVEDKPVSPEKAKTNQAQEFFQNTALGDAIKKTNE